MFIPIVHVYSHCEISGSIIIINIIVVLQDNIISIAFKIVYNSKNESETFEIKTLLITII